MTRQEMIDESVRRALFGNASHFAVGSQLRKDLGLEDQFWEDSKECATCQSIAESARRKFNELAWNQRLPAAGRERETWDNLCEDPEGRLHYADTDRLVPRERVEEVRAKALYQFEIDLALGKVKMYAP